MLKNLPPRAPKSDYFSLTRYAPCTKDTMNRPPFLDNLSPLQTTSRPSQMYTGFTFQNAFNLPCPG